MLDMVKSCSSATHALWSAGSLRLVAIVQGVISGELAASDIGIASAGFHTSALARRRAVVSGNDVIVVEGTLHDPNQGDDWALPFCVELTIVDGRIVRDDTSTDYSRLARIRLSR